MQTNVITIAEHFSPQIEAYINNMEAELNDFAELQGKEDAEKFSDIAEPIVKIKVYEPVQSEVQTGIDVVRKTLLPASQIHDVNEADQMAQKRLQVISNEINDKKQKRSSLKRKQATLTPDPVKLAYGRYFLPASLIAGFADGGVAYSNFRNGSYPPALAFFTALAIALVISLSHIAYTPWIKKASTERQRTSRVLLILITAFIFFLLISSLRAGAAGNTVDISIENDDISAPRVSNISGLPIAIASTALFALVLFLALRFWMSKKERLELQEYHGLGKDIEKLDTEITSLDREKKQIEESIALQKSQARKVFDYALNCIRKCKNIGLNAVSKYKQTYARFHNDQVPGFFSEPCNFIYDEALHFPKLKTTESV